MERRATCALLYRENCLMELLRAIELAPSAELRHRRALIGPYDVVFSVVRTDRRLKVHSICRAHEVWTVFTSQTASGTNYHKSLLHKQCSEVSQGNEARNSIISIATFEEPYQHVTLTTATCWC
jgi:hypothetical protein